MKFLKVTVIALIAVMAFGNADAQMRRGPHHRHHHRHHPPMHHRH